MGVSEYPRVVGVISQEGTDLTAICNEAAGYYAFPPRVLVACAIAESDLSAQAARERAWPDVSYGPWQQTVKWAADYGIGTGQDTPENRATVRAILTEQPRVAADIAARQLGHWWAQEGNPINAMCRYNRPGGDPATNPNRGNYERGWAASAQYIAPDEEPEEPMTDHSFELGFKDLADALGGDVVGEPVTDEFPIGDGPDSGTGATLQVTTQGVMVYASGAGARFLASRGA